MSTNYDSFIRSFRKATKGFDSETLAIVQKKLAFDILSGVVARTPVLTGRARGGWQVTIGAPTDLDSGNEDKSGLTVTANAQTVLANLGVFQIVYIQNNVEYIGYLEEGTDKMAPFKMMALTLQEQEGVFG